MEVKTLKDLLAKGSNLPKGKVNNKSPEQNKISPEK